MKVYAKEKNVPIINHEHVTVIMQTSLTEIFILLTLTATNSLSICNDEAQSFHFNFLLQKQLKQ